MPGPERQNKHNVLSEARKKPYSRSVRFSDSASVIPEPTTPAKPHSPATMTSGSEGHKQKKRDIVLEKRRRSMLLGRSLRSGRLGGTCMTDDDVARESSMSVRPLFFTNTGLPSLMDLSPRNARRGTSATDPFASNGGPAPEDFQDYPSVTFLDKLTTQPSVATLQNEIASLKERLRLQTQNCRCASFERESEELRAQNQLLTNKCQILLAMVKKTPAAKSAKKETLLLEVEVHDEMCCDADDEYDPLSATSASFSSRLSASVSAPVLSFTPSPSSSLSSASTEGELRTPADTPCIPVREIDEDYDEGYNPHAARLANIRADVSHKYGLTPDMGIEETIDQIAEALTVRWGINDDEDAPVQPAPPSDLVFPPLVVPTMPKFNF
ncbi:hypothetical protein M0805_002496 [Coniferiporia weirii]|nr:hypothetical protein M0805_002496 [Coniferiporia weirii]